MNSKSIDADNVISEVERVDKRNKSLMICDYAGYSCECTGFKAKSGSLCVCGHSKNQHHKNIPMQVSSERSSR